MDGLDLVRAVAISLVLFCHGAMFFEVVHGAPAFWDRTGAMGVTLFFVLSGFLIGGLVMDQGERLRQPREALRFWLRRILRTFPNYYLFFSLNVAYWYWVARHRGWPAPGRELLPTAFFVQNLSHPPGSFFSESWSLSVEEWFYALLPLGLLALMRLGLRFIAAYWAVLGAMAVASILFRQGMPPVADWQAGSTTVVLGRFDSLAIGMAAASVCRAYPEAWRRLSLPAGIAGMLGLLESFLFMARTDLGDLAFARRGFLTVLPLCCALVLPWATTRRPWPRLIAAPVRAISRWAYSMYLVNLVVSFNVLPHVQLRYGTAAGLAAYVATVLGFSAAVYYALERPILRWRDRNPFLSLRGA